MNKIRVQLSDKLAKRGQCLVDPGNGITITKARYQSGAQVVFNTGFVRGRIASGELIEVREPAPAETAKMMEVIFSKDCEIGGKEFKKGDSASFPEPEALEMRSRKLIR